MIWWPVPAVLTVVAIAISLLMPISGEYAFLGRVGSFCAAVMASVVAWMVWALLFAMRWI